MPAKAKSNEIRITRMYDAPVEAVWDAWTDPKQAAQWWGPRGFTLTTHSKDLRPGGTWAYTMHGPDGTDYPNKTLYLEVERHAKLVYDHGGNDDRPPMFRVTVLFSEVSGKTRMEMSMTLPTPEAAEETRKFIRMAGGNATWDRLAEYLTKESSGKEQFVINVYTQQFCDEHEKLSRHPMSPRMAGHHADDRQAVRRGRRQYPSDRDVGAVRADHREGTGNVHQGSCGHDPGLDRIVRQTG